MPYEKITISKPNIEDSKDLLKMLEKVSEIKAYSFGICSHLDGYKVRFYDRNDQYVTICSAYSENMAEAFYLAILKFIENLDYINKIQEEKFNIKEIPLEG